MPESKKLVWDQTGERFYETGVEKGVLYVRDTTGTYPKGVAWNGLISVSESPSGAEPSPLYADNIKYLNLVSAEEFGASIEAYSSPEEFDECDGTAQLVPGVFVGQQARKTFGFVYVTKIGNDVENHDLGYKIHIVYGCLASPSDKQYSSINDSPEAMTLSWDITTTPVPVPNLKPTALIIVESTKCSSVGLKAIEDALFGTDSSEAHLPLPADLLSLLNTEKEPPEEEPQG